MPSARDSAHGSFVCTRIIVGNLANEVFKIRLTKIAADVFQSLSDVGSQLLPSILLVTHATPILPMRHCLH
jgi:hypothetical protein